MGNIVTLKNVSPSPSNLTLPGTCPAEQEETCILWHDNAKLWGFENFEDDFEIMKKKKHCKGAKNEIIKIKIIRWLLLTCPKRKVHRIKFLTAVKRRRWPASWQWQWQCDCANLAQVGAATACEVKLTSFVGPTRVGLWESHPHRETYLLLPAIVYNFPHGDPKHVCVSWRNKPPNKHVTSMPQKPHSVRSPTTRRGYQKNSGKKKKFNYELSEEGIWIHFLNQWQVCKMVCDNHPPNHATTFTDLID